VSYFTPRKSISHPWGVRVLQVKTTPIISTYIGITDEIKVKKKIRGRERLAAS
jgi:hypothetical protein